MRHLAQSVIADEHQALAAQAQLREAAMAHSKKQATKAQAA